MSVLKVPRDLTKIINRRLTFVNVLIFIVFVILFLTVYNVFVQQEDYYVELLNSKNIVYAEELSAAPGRIYDRNYNIIVDNEPVPSLVYERESGVNTEKEIEIAYAIAELIYIDPSKLSTRDKKDFFISMYPTESEELIESTEWDAFNTGSIDDLDIYKLKLERIGDEQFTLFEEIDLRAAAIFSEMRKGDFIIKSDDLTEEEYFSVSEKLHDFPGFRVIIDWKRTYPYGTCFNTMLGRRSTSSQGLPADELEEYLAKGYTLTDRVGLSFIEEQYEDLLKGENRSYKISSDGTYEIVNEGSRGNDIVLNIDMELQCAVEDILKEEMLGATEEELTEYYDQSFVVLQDPMNGQILAMAGGRIMYDDNDEPYIIDWTHGISNMNVTPGSVVKGASLLTGYNEGVVSIGEKIYDEPIKIANTPQKSSFENMGLIDDIYALARSSNVYQYKVAMRIGDVNYVPGGRLDINYDAFDIYRNSFAQFGLGTITGIDLPYETTGMQPNKNNLYPGHLLDFAIGQLDNYTAIQLSQYVSTIANGGYRIQPRLLKEVYYPTQTGELSDLMYEVEPTILNVVNTEDKYLERIQEGFRAVFSHPKGIGFDYMGDSPEPAGKTGTAQSFGDPDGDGIWNTETITKTFIGYAPYSDPEVSIITTSSNISRKEDDGTYGFQSDVNKRITQRIMNLYFEKTD
jgi:cell division protein FtsI/penicillin-binding protein 2